jgi:hypothetical protein
MVATLLAVGLTAIHLGLWVLTFIQLDAQISLVNDLTSIGERGRHWGLRPRRVEGLRTTWSATRFRDGPGVAPHGRHDTTRHEPSLPAMSAPGRKRLSSLGAGDIALHC